MADASEKFPRLETEQLTTLRTRNNNWLGVTPHFWDRSELLSLVQLGALLDYDQSHSGSLELGGLIQHDSPVSVLNRRMSTHGKPRDISFNSPRKPEDVSSEDMAQLLLERQRASEEHLEKGKTPYYFRGYTPEVVDGVIDGVAAQQEIRTRSLLGDFVRDFDRITDTAVWLHGVPRSKGGAAIFASQLAGFTIHGAGSETVIEPVVVSRNGKRGLLPNQDFYIYPQLNIRIKY
jgi:hypothetical protein